MTLEDFGRQIPRIATLAHGEKIRLFAWWLHTYGNRSHFKPKDIAQCYKGLSLAETNVSSMLDYLCKQRLILKDRNGYKLERSVHDGITEKYGQREATIHVHKLLADLPSKIPSIAEKAYLDETLTCLRNSAFRATVVMAWNLAYDHLCEWILAGPQRLADFNAQTPKTYPRAGLPVVVARDDFLDFKESQVLQVAKSARVITDNVHKVLKEKLDRRNIAAHPSGVKILQSTAEEVIRDLVENVVLVLV